MHETTQIPNREHTGDQPAAVCFCPQQGCLNNPTVDRRWSTLLLAWVFAYRGAAYVHFHCEDAAATEAVAAAAATAAAVAGFGAVVVVVATEAARVAAARRPAATAGTLGAVAASSVHPTEVAAGGFAAVVCVAASSATSASDAFVAVAGMTDSLATDCLPNPSENVQLGCAAFVGAAHAAVAAAAAADLVAATVALPCCHRGLSHFL